MKLRVQQIRNTLRKQQLQKEFERRRKELLTKRIEQEHIQQPNANLSKQFEQILDTIIKGIHQRKTQIALQFLNRLIQIIQNNTYASTCLFIHSAKVSELIELVFRNEVVKQNNSEYQLLNLQMQTQITDCILTALQKINYNSLDQDTYFQILKSFWLILTLKNINIQSSEGLHLLEKTILIIVKMMSRPNEIVYKYLKELGIGSKIVQLIEDIRLIQKDRICGAFSEMVSLYLQHQHLFEKEKGSQIGGVHILGMQNNQKEHILAFCLGLLASDHPKILENSVSTISNILLRFQYFSHSISKQQVARFFQLMSSGRRNIQQSVLEIFHSLLFVSAEGITPFVKNMALLDLIEKQLRKQLKCRDILTSNMVQKYINIISNITFEVSKETKKKLYEHSIWQLIFHNLHLDSCLFPLIITFEYFFEFIPREKLLAFIEPYCVAVGELQMDLVQTRYKDSINNTLLRVFYTIRDFYSEGMFQAYVRIIESNKLRVFLEEELDSLMWHQA